MRSDWHRDFFHGLVVQMWAACVPPEQTEREVQFAVDRLAIPPGGRVLDLPCGHGRHAVALTRRGFQVTGVDYSTDALRLARAAAQAAQVAVAWRVADMRDAEFEEPFDAALTLGNSFAYLDHAGTRQFLARLAAALRPGGRWLLETGVAAESLLPHLEPRLAATIGDIQFEAENTYHADSSSLETRYTLRRGETIQTGIGWHQVYTVGEIVRLLVGAGLRVVSLHGGADGSPFALGSHNLFVLAARA
jgi:SAM-dependent methyltransferase